MGRPKKNAAANQTADQTAGTPAAEAAPATAATGIAPITMADFMALPNRADYMSIRDAAKRVYGDAYEAKHDQNLRNAAKGNDAFKPAGALVSVEVEGYSIPPLTYLRADAIDAYAEAQRSGTANVGRMRGGKKRHIIRLSPEDEAAYRAGTLSLTVDNYPLEVASTPKETKAQKEARLAAEAAKNAANQTSADAPSSDDQTGDQTGDAASAEQPPAADAANQIDGDDTTDESAARF